MFRGVVRLIGITFVTKHAGSHQSIGRRDVLHDKFKIGPVVEDDLVLCNEQAERVRHERETMIFRDKASGPDA